MPVAAGETKNPSPAKEIIPDNAAIVVQSRAAAALAVRSTLDGTVGQPPIIALRDRIQTDAIPLSANNGDVGNGAKVARSLDI